MRKDKKHINVSPRKALFLFTITGSIIVLILLILSIKMVRERQSFDTPIHFSVDGVIVSQQGVGSHEGKGDSMYFEIESTTQPLLNRFIYYLPGTSDDDLPDLKGRKVHIEGILAADEGGLVIKIDKFTLIKRMGTDGIRV